MLAIWPMAMGAAGLAALAIGALSLRTTGVYFIMVTLAFAQMIYYFALSWPSYGGADGLSLAQLVRAMGFTATTLQQQFRLAFGKAVFDYLRASRLQRAALALQHDGVSVARAAEIAGYSSQANFSTAFRRHFGLSPKHYRVKV